MQFEQEVVISAPTVEEAVILGLARLGVTRDSAEIEILDEGSKGFLGLGFREARVRVKQLPPPVPVTPAPVTPAASEPAIKTPQAQIVTAPPSHVVSTITPGAGGELAPEKPTSAPPAARKTEKQPGAGPQTPKPVVRKPAPEKPAPGRVAAQEARPARASESFETLPPADREAIEKTTLEVAQHFFEALELQVTVEWREEDRQTLWVSVRGKDADVLVGPQAQTLDSIQYLLRTVVRHRVQGNYDLVLDADGYRDRRLRSLATLARNTADKAVKQGKAVQLRPMPAGDRRVIHMTLRSDARVRTQSTGSGRSRAVTVIPVDRAE